MKNNETKRHKKFKKHNLVLQVLGFFILILVGIIISPMMTGKKVDTETNNQNVTGDSILQQASYKYNPDNGQLLAEYWIGDKKNLGSLNDDKDLSNIKYATRALMASDNSRLKTKSHKINDHFLVIEINNIKPKFNTIEVDILPQKIDSEVEMGDFNKENINKFFIKEDKVILLQGNLFKQKNNYKEDYNEFMITRYQKLINHKQKLVDKANATITHDQNQIEKLEAQKSKATASDKTDIKNQVENYRSDISSMNENKKLAQEKIDEAKESITAIKNGTAIQ